MRKHFDSQDDASGELRKQVLGLGERSFRKTWYPELQQRLDELELFRSLLDCTDEAILLIRVDTMRVVDANRTALLLLSASREQLRSEPIDQYVPSLVVSRLASGERNVGSTVLLERWPTVDEDRELETAVRFAGEGEQAYAILMVRDVTERRAIERQALTAQRLESVGRLAGGIAHDFNNLLCAILGTVDLVRTDLPADSTAASDLADVMLVAQRAALLTRRLMTFSRAGTASATLVNVATLVQDLERLLLRVIGERARLQLQLDAERAWVLADSIALEQVIVNLVANARDAVQSTGTITVRVFEASEDDAEAPDNLHPYCVLEVEDDGCGMDETTQRKAFEPFFTTKPVGQGTGIGLAVVTSALAQYRGTLRLRSSVGQGSRFRLYFPRHEAPTEGRPTPPSYAQAIGNGRIVLLVEDDRLLRSTIKRILQKHGFDVAAAEDLDEALFRARRLPKTPSLVITDMVLPDATGQDIALRLRSLFGQLPFLFISGYSTAEDLHVDQHHLESLLPKPFSPAELIANVARLLGD